MRGMKLRADRGDWEILAARGLSTGEFQQLYRRLTLLLVGSAIGPGVHAWINPEARRRLPDGAAAACVACLGDALWANGPV
jgi:hypothetical protein